jgi:hypothetical protein
MPSINNQVLCVIKNRQRVTSDPGQGGYRSEVRKRVWIYAGYRDFLSELFPVKSGKYLGERSGFRSSVGGKWRLPGDVSFRGPEMTQELPDPSSLAN